MAEDSNRNQRPQYAPSAYLIESAWVVVVSLALALFFGGFLLFIITNWNSDLVGKILPPFGSAFLGAGAAYYLGLRKEEVIASKQKKSAVNRAIFSLADLATTVKQLEEDYIEPVRGNPILWFDMTTPRANSLQIIQLDIESLSFLLDPPSSNSRAPTTLFDLHKLINNYNVLLRTIELRSAAIENKLNPALQSMQPPFPTNTLAADWVKTFRQPIYQEVDSLSNLFIESVDTIIGECHRLYKQLHGDAIRFFPNEEFTTVDFLEAAATSEARS